MPEWRWTGSIQQQRDVRGPPTSLLATKSNLGQIYHLEMQFPWTQDVYIIFDPDLKQTNFGVKITKDTFLLMLFAT